VTLAACARTCVGAVVANAASTAVAVPKYNACLIVIFRSVVTSGLPDRLIFDASKLKAR